MTVRSTLGCFPLLVLLTAGCGGGSLPPAADPDEARHTLNTALEAWKNGETAEGLASRQPPIYFNDLRPEQRLLSFTIAEGHEMYGQSVRLTVTLTMKQSDGSTKERKTTFLVDTSPVRVIVLG